MGSNMTGDERPVFFFDIDNCLYSRSKEVHHQMGKLIDEYFQSHLSLSAEDALDLHMKYYRDYGLAIEGLVRHHKVDPMEYNRKVDDALPLEDVLSPDPHLRKLLESLDRTQVKPWLFTNAYITHGKRVVRLLGIEDQFEGITYCDYGAPILLCKPHVDMFAKAEREAGATSSGQCYFVDDSALNTKAAEALGWTSVHLVEPSLPLPEQAACRHTVRSLDELQSIFPQFFKSARST